jgi:predicted DNA-binding transcriptional regulator YafY
MRRADRLFQIIEHLRGRASITARELSEQLEVSERTIYRDIQDLMKSGVPIEGAAGVGYALRRGFDLPPIMFDGAELEALVVSARLVQALGGDGLAEAALRALHKIEAVLPAARRHELNASRLFAPREAVNPRSTAQLDLVRRAIAARRLIALDYVRQDGERSRREIRPLAIVYWPPNWLLAAWCELRRDFRTFRTDRIQAAELLERTYRDEPGTTFDDYLRGLPDERC